jgi:predicted phage terminase large subunit-like protein
MLDLLDSIDRRMRRIDKWLPKTPRPCTESKTESLLDFIPRITPRYQAPAHLRALTELFERAERERVLAVVSMPPRHGKTETELHGIAWTLKRTPQKQVAFVGYAARFAEKKSRKARELAIKAGVPIAADAASRQDWRTGVEDGGLWATSIGGQMTGEGFHLMLVDDPVKDRATAESSVYRDHHYDWFNDTAFTRLEPNGSCIVTQTRWHPDDLAGRLITDGWELVNLPAVRADDTALWPERWPLEKLRVIEEQLGVYGWESLYQGNPRTRGGALFHDAVYHADNELPKTGLRIALGFDLAYTAKTHADYSVVVALAMDKDGVAYVLDVKRMQAEATVFGDTMRKMQTEHGGAVLTGFVGGTEQGVVQFLTLSGIRMHAIPAREDKFVRAQPVAAAWNAGRVRLPHDKPWLSAFVGELADFTGVGDRHDDQVDALAGAYHALASTVTGAPRAFQTKFTPSDTPGGKSPFQW